MLEGYVERGLVKCGDEDCPGPAEIEQDGEYRYYECVECGMAFGYHKVAVPGADDNCAIGVPEDVRRAASGGRMDVEEAPTPAMIPSIGFGTPE